MARKRIQRALIAVYDKTGVAEFARALADEFGIEIISTGGTAKHLRAAGVPVTLVEEVTGFPEMLDGRVKTLHPAIHAAILADRDNPDHLRQLSEQGIRPIDMVVVNLYPFEKTVADPNASPADAIEMIDIGGPCLLRAAAKNHEWVLPLCDPADFALVLSILRAAGGVTRRFAAERAQCVFDLTRGYDLEVAAYLFRLFGEGPPPQPNVPRTSGIPARISGLLKERVALRYGENPHQCAGLFDADSFLPPGRRNCGPMLRGLALPGSAPISFNNCLDADAALGLCAELTRAGNLEPPPNAPRGSTPPAVALFVKHANPCGVGVAADPIEAYRRAFLGDPNAAMGGILACNFDVTPLFAEFVLETYERFGKSAGAGGFFVEVWLAPDFDPAAVDIIRTRKKWGANVRLLAVGDLTAAPSPDEYVYRSIAGGMLVQTPDLVGLNEEQWRVVTKRPPDEREWADLRLAWLVAKHTRSNAISLCRDGMLIGNGAGQMSRVMSCRVATWLARDNGHGDRLRGAAAASDAFFPFRDGPDLLLEAGVTAIIQPGGSKRDAETIAACDDRGAVMIFTSTRHFRH